ncbi:hypothetical protein OAU26_04635 [Mariniblastus sp.]|nr:hypothetical protein [Mariniblastus sp.]
MSSIPFEEFSRVVTESGVEPSLDFLEQHFRREQDFFKLFEILKMRCRHQLGLPLIYSKQPDDLDETQQRQLEDSLLEACREIGILFFKSGKFQEGWMYLQPVGDKELNEKLIRKIEADEESIDALIDMAVSQGAAPVYGYRLLLKNYGTCNGITTFDTQANRFDAEIQKEMAEELLAHIYLELVENVKYSIENGEAGSVVESSEKVPASQAEEDRRLTDWLEMYPDLTAGGAHHIDTTHLASVMRIARPVDNRESLLKVSELAEYGSRLHEDFNYPGNAPFEDTYHDHQLFYNALLGQNVDTAIEHFLAKTVATEADQLGPVVEETYVEFLSRLGKNTEAVEFLTDRLLGKFESMGIAPPPFELADTPESLKKLRDFYQSTDDLLGYAVCCLKQSDVSG